MNELLRKIPKVDELLRSPSLAETIAQYGDRAVTEAIRAELDALRKAILANLTDTMPGQETLARRISNRVRMDSLPSFRRVINGTGIILHTNLGRACLSVKAALAAAVAASSYSNL